MEPTTPAPVVDVTEADFEQRVIERSRELAVIVDFWAEWCAPCRQLAPVLERAVTERAGRVELVKVDVDANQGIAARHRVQSLPSVKAFRDGAVASEFTGALPPAEVERFLDALLPSEAQELAASAAAGGDEQGLRRALELDPRQSAPAASLAQLLLARGDAQEALDVAQPLAEVDFACAGAAARARLVLDGDAPAEAFAAWDEGDLPRALEGLQEAVAATADPNRRDLLRRVMVGLFTALGPDSELAREHRRRLASALS